MHWQTHSAGGSQRTWVQLEGLVPKAGQHPCVVTWLWSSGTVSTQLLHKTPTVSSSPVSLKGGERIPTLPH